MATPLPVLSLQVDMAGNDEVVANERSRATRFPVTLTGTAALGSAYVTTPQGVNWIAGYGPPRTGTSAGTTLTILAADSLTGIITWKSTAGANVTTTLDSATNIINAVNSISSGAQVGDVISCLIINSTGSTAGSTLTITPGSGGSLDANQSAPVIAVGASRVVYIYISNITPGSQAYVVYT